MPKILARLPLHQKAAVVAAGILLVALVGIYLQGTSPQPDTRGQTQASSADQSSDESWDQVQRNSQNLAQDPFVCNTSIEGKPILSFDHGLHWWTDDGRCAVVIKRKQKKKDEDAQVYSFWPTTIRVETNIDSSWLHNEERTCETHPDDGGRVSTVICGTDSGRRHNIPIKFWGSIERNTVSDWRCRNESNDFVCRAVN